jgi:uncharacterized membrane protein
MGSDVGRYGLATEAVAVLGVLSLAVGAVFFLPAGNPLRVLAAVLVVLVLPGYALLTLVFPARRREQASPRRASLGDVERFALSIGVSLGLVPVFGYTLAVAGIALRFRAIVTLVAAVTVVASVLGVLRRLRLPPAHRYALTVGGSPGRLRSWVAGPTRLDTALNLGLSVAVVVALSGLAFGIALPARESAYTEASLLRATDDGYVAADYETEIAPGASTTYVVNVTNQEGEPVSYVVVAQQQTIGERSARGAEVTETRVVDQFREQVADGRTWRIRHRFAPEVDDERTRLAYLVYRGSAPEDPSVESAYRHVTVWYDLQQPG